VHHDWEYYIVYNDVWAAAEAPMGPRGFLCIGCLEARLGRELTPEDFPICDLNRPGGSRRLDSRLG
jgi:hypothetical protein